MSSTRPRTPQLSAQDGQGATQDATKMRQEPPKSCPRGVQEAAHGRLGAKTRHKAPPHSLQTSILNNFGNDLEGFWHHFGWILGGQTNWIDILATIRWHCWGAAPPQERTVAGTPLCGARDTTSPKIMVNFG